MTALVFLNGECDISDDRCRIYAAEADALFCADGGARHFHKLGLVPSLAAGDMDSIGSELLDFFRSSGVELKRFPKEKDSSDAELLLDLLCERGFTDITVLGALGGRFDHMMGNIFLLERYRAKGVSVKIISRHSEIEAVRGTKEVRGRKGLLFSLFSLSDYSVVTLHGFRYPLSFSRVGRGTTLGLSNIIDSDDASVVVHEGTSIMIIQEENI